MINLKRQKELQRGNVKFSQLFNVKTEMGSVPAHFQGYQSVTQWIEEYVTPVRNKSPVRIGLGLAQRGAE